jgi:hypothetical protein
VAVASRWIFSRRVDLGVFGGSALASLVLLAVGARLGLLHDDAPEWTWVTAVLLVDVAHVWSTGFLILDPGERARHGRLWILVPVVGYAAGVTLYAAAGAAAFWRALAYLAVFHFVRQQWGWVALYRRRAGEPDGWGRWLDAAAIYAATLYPLVYWHAHLPRRFVWFVPGDFAVAPAAAVVAHVAFPAYLAVLAAYAIAAVVRAVRGHATPGKDLVVATTALCWWLGIVAFDSDYAFTVTNVLVHGVPYFALVFLVARARGVRALAGASAWPVFLGALWALAFAEELLWDRSVWHERAWLFGTSWTGLDALRPYLVPLLALPQLTHYVLDGFIWRRRHAPLFGTARAERRASARRTSA